MATAADHAWIFYLIVALFGGAIGLSELIARYKDSPVAAALTLPGLFYMALNAAGSWLALFLMKTMGEPLGAITWSFDRTTILSCMLAAFGSMAFFRSSIFVVRVGETDLGVGPAGFLQILLGAADRACDRKRAQPRSQAVSDIMRGVSFDLASEALVSYCFGLMQNVTPDEQRAFGNLVEDLKKSKMSAGFKSLNLGLALMNIVGERVLRAAVDTLGGRIRGPLAAQLDTILLLNGVDYDADYQGLITACQILAADDHQRAGWFSSRNPWADPDLRKVGDDIKNLDIDAENKVLLLATELLGRYGDSVVQTAIRLVKTARAPQQPQAAPAAAPPPPPPANQAPNIVPMPPAQGLPNP